MIPNNTPRFIVKINATTSHVSILADALRVVPRLAMYSYYPSDLANDICYKGCRVILTTEEIEMIEVPLLLNGIRLDKEPYDDTFDN
jgi:hypothetical protein